MAEQGPGEGLRSFRQFIVDWDQQDKLTDEILMCFLTAYLVQIKLFLRVGVSI